MADHYPADMIFLDDRPSSLQLDTLGTNPAWSNLPAVKAGKIRDLESGTRAQLCRDRPYVQRSG